MTSGRYNISRPLLSLTSCKLHTVVQDLGSSQHHQLVGGVAGVTFVELRGWVELPTLVGGCL